MGINQIEKPKAGDVFFNNAAGGGISTCITCGEPGLNVLPNCVGGAVGAYNKQASGDKPEFKYLNYPPNAENILARGCIQTGLVSFIVYYKWDNTGYRFLHHRDCS